MRLIDLDEFYDLRGDDYETYEEECDATDRALSRVHIIKEIPTVHAHWFDRGSLSCRCSNCGCKNTEESYHCPHCFAVMDEDK